MWLSRSKDHIPKAELNDYFEKFHSNEIKYLKKAAELLNVNELSFSLGEIDAFGTLYRKQYKKPEKVGMSYDEFLDVFITYYGHAWMHYFGGNWFDTIDKKDYAHGFCQVIDWGPEGFEWMGIPPHNYAFIIESGNKEPLSRVIKREIESFKRKGIDNFKKEQL